MAARIRPNSGGVRSIWWVVEKICWISQELAFIASQAMAKISPISPTRL